MTEKKRNPALDKKARERLEVVRGTIENLVQHHFPDANPNHIEEPESVFGISKHSRDDMHHMRLFIPEEKYAPMYPPFLHCSYTIPPGLKAEDKHDSTTDIALNDLRDDLNRLLTGSKQGELIDIATSMDAAGKILSKGTQEVVRASASDQSHSADLLLSGNVTELYERIQKNLALPENADLRQFKPAQSSYIG